MKIISLYILIGTLFSAFTDYAHFKAKDTWSTNSPIDWESSRLNNFDRFWLIAIWPIGVIIVIFKLFSNKS